MAAYVGFNSSDGEYLRNAAQDVAPYRSAIVDRFYEAVLAHSATRAVLSSGPHEVNHLQSILSHWVETLFCGQYDSAYWDRRFEIGRTHTSVGLPQHYMFAAIEILWREFEAVLRRPEVADADAKIRALHKLLSIETAVMLESYKDSYVHRVRLAERDAMRERLMQAERLAETGQLAASLAHEIKNPLAGISGAVQVIRDATSPDDPHRPILGEVLRQIDRLDGTVKDLLIYARPKPPRFKHFDLNQIIERTLAGLSREPELRRVRLEYAGTDPLNICADEVQIEQLLVNLLLNAAQASTDGALVRLTVNAGDDEFELLVEDRGQGISEELRPRVFEPFFTSKAKGTGLGLSICRKIVESHGGVIKIETAVGQGTTVAVRLPDLPPAARTEQDDEDTRSDR
jgi:signal transduction histidine kinase